MKIKVIIISVITCLLVVGSVGGVFAFNFGKKKKMHRLRKILNHFFINSKN